MGLRQMGRRQALCRQALCRQALSRQALCHQMLCRTTRPPPQSQSKTPAISRQNARARAVPTGLRVGRVCGTFSLVSGAVSEVLIGAASEVRAETIAARGCPPGPKPATFLTTRHRQKNGT